MREDINNDFPVFNISELKWNTEVEEIHDMSIEQKTIQNLEEIVAIADRHTMSVNIKECVLMEVQIDSVNIDRLLHFFVKVTIITDSRFII